MTASGQQRGEPEDFGKEAKAWSRNGTSGLPVDIRKSSEGWAEGLGTFWPGPEEAQIDLLIP